MTKNRIFRKFVSLSKDDAGDVPGWVLITLMTAGLVIVIWSAAGPALAGVFEQAISRVTSRLRFGLQNRLTLHAFGFSQARSSLH